MGVNLDEGLALMTAETSALKPESSVLAHFMAGRALDGSNGGMLMKRSETGRRVRSDKKMDVRSPALPQQSEKMQTGAYRNNCVKHIRKGLFGGERVAVQLKFAQRRSRNDIGLTAGQHRAIDRTHNLSF